jgi:hypothetical protein
MNECSNKGSNGDLHLPTCHSPMGREGIGYYLGIVNTCTFADVMA